MKEEIKSKFGAIAQEYDNQRKLLIPCFDDFYTCIVDSIAYSTKHSHILDIGAGTGLLTSFIYHVYSGSHYTLIDISEEMINQAKKRFTGLGNFDYIIADYSNYKFNKKFDVVVSALSIHHIENKEKEELFQKIFDILESGGIFINGDQFLSRSPSIEESIQNKWKLRIFNSGLSKKEIDGAYARMKMDKPATVEKNIEWLERAGFINADLLYKYYPFGVVCAAKP